MVNRRFQRGLQFAPPHHVGAEALLAVFVQRHAHVVRAVDAKLVQLLALHHLLRRRFRLVHRLLRLPRRRRRHRYASDPANGIATGGARGRAEITRGENKVVAAAAHDAATTDAAADDAAAAIAPRIRGWQTLHASSFNEL